MRAIGRRVSRARALAKMVDQVDQGPQRSFGLGGVGDKK
jgi:hypothetical protein